MVAGRVAITERALERTVMAIAAGHLRVPITAVRVQLADDAGLLAVAVTAPVRTAPLRAPGRGDGMVTVVQGARSGIRDDITIITGRTVSRVSITVSRAEVFEEKRAR